MKNIEIIAEIGWNHMGDIDLASRMIKEAKDSGANTAKFQYWDPKTLKAGAWDSDGRREIYNKACLDDEKIIKLKQLSEREGLKFLISVFSVSGAKKIADLGIEEIKIPSHEVANYKLINFSAENFKKIYFSAGAGTKEEVIKSNDILEKKSNDYILMHCVSSYPCPENKSNLSRLDWLHSLHPQIGLSDHTQSTIVPAISVSKGVIVIEKHFTSDNNLPGRDNEFALNPNDFSVMVSNIDIATQCLLDHGIDLQDIEKDTYENYRGRWDPSDY